MPCAGQLAKLHLCSLLVMEEEGRRAERYVWVVKMRPDVISSPPSPRWQVGLDGGTVYRSSHSHDLMMYIPRAALSAVARGWRDVGCASSTTPSSTPSQTPPSSRPATWPIGCNRLIDASLQAAGVRSAVWPQLCDCQIRRTPEAAAALDEFGLSGLAHQSRGSHQQRTRRSPNPAPAPVQAPLGPEVHGPFRRFSNARHRGELAELANALNLTGEAAEIGVWHGGFSRHNLNVWRGKRYYMIDPWAYRANDSAPVSDKNYASSEAWEAHMQMAYNSTAEWVKSGRAVMMKRCRHHRRSSAWRR